MGLKQDAQVFTELARQQRTGLENIENAYNARIVDVKSNPVVYNRPVSFKGGIRKMTDARRIRMASGSEPTSDASDSDVSGASGGEINIIDSKGPPTPTELAMKQRQNQIMLLDLEEELARKMAARAARVAAAAAGSAAGVAATPAAATGDAATTGAKPAAATVAKPVSKCAARGKYMKVPRNTTPEEHDGLREVVKAVDEAYQRAKARGLKDSEHRYMKQFQAAFGTIFAKGGHGV